MHIHLVDRTFLKNPKWYFIQSLMAVAAVTILLYFVEAITHAAIVAALGSSVFIVFTMPKTIAAQPRRLIGGHFTGIIAGLFCYYTCFHSPLLHIFESEGFVRYLPAAFAIGLSILLMTILNFEHPPAAGTALGMVTQEWTLMTIIFIVVFSVSLALIGFLLKKYLRNLCT